MSLTDTPGAGIVGPAAAGCTGTTTLTCPVGTLAPGASVPFTVTATADPSLASGTVLTNTATVTATTADPVAANNSATASSTTSAPSADVAVTKSGPASVTPGVTFDYDMTVHNNGPSQAAGVTLTDTLPSGVTFVSATGATCSAAVECTLGTVPAGATVPVTLTVMPDSGLIEGTVLVNTVTVSSTTADPAPADNTATADVTVGPSVANVTIAKDAPATMVAGQDAVYDITVTNTGPSVAHDVRGVDVLPAGLTFVSSAPDYCSAIGQTVTCFAPELFVHSVQILVTVHVAANVPEGTQLLNGASASSPDDPDIPPVPPTPGPPVQTVADLNIVKTAPATVTAGGSFDYPLTVSNAGPSDAQAVTVTDTLPAGVTLTAATGATCSGAPVVCGVGTLAAGGLTTVTLHVTAASSLAAGTSLVNTATVTSPTNDPATGNNTDTAMSTVGPPSADLRIAKTGPDTAVPGTQVSYPARGHQRRAVRRDRRGRHRHPAGRIDVRFQQPRGLHGRGRLHSRVAGRGRLDHGHPDRGGRQ